MRLPQYTYMRAFELRINTTVIGVQLLEPLPSKPGIWRVVATANGVPVGSSLTLSNGIKIDRVAGDIGKFGTVKIDAGEAGHDLLSPEGAAGQASALIAGLLQHFYHRAALVAAHAIAQRTQMQLACIGCVTEGGRRARTASHPPC